MSVITNTPQSSREDAQNLSLSCVVRFDEEVGERQHISCGLSDATGLLHAMHRFAFAWGCGVVVPPPSDLLAAQCRIAHCSHCVVVALLQLELVATIPAATAG